MPQPTPVDTVTYTMLRLSRPAPYRYSPYAAAFASFSSVTGHPNRPGKLPANGKINPAQRRRLDHHAAGRRQRPRACDADAIRPLPSALLRYRANQRHNIIQHFRRLAACPRLNLPARTKLAAGKARGRNLGSTDIHHNDLLHSAHEGSFPNAWPTGLPPRQSGCFQTITALNSAFITSDSIRAIAGDICNSCKRERGIPAHTVFIVNRLIAVSRNMRRGGQAAASALDRPEHNSLDKILLYKRVHAKHGNHCNKHLSSIESRFTHFRATPQFFTR